LARCHLGLVGRLTTQTSPVVGKVVSEEALGRSPPSALRLSGLTPLHGGANLSAMVGTRLVRNRALDYGLLVTCGCLRAQR
jgi:hypothetical protein